MKKVFKVLGFIVLLIALLVIGGISYIKMAKPDVGKAPDIKIAVTPERVERGKYLANAVAVCMDCHAQRDWSLFAGPLKPGTFGAGGDKFGHEIGFPGEYYSKNITPYALKTWTDGEIYRAVTMGVSKSGEPLMPLMPYHYYGQADTADIYAIIAYLRTIPEVKNDVKPAVSDFPFSLIIRTIPHKGTPMPKPAESDNLAYGKYIVNFAGCVECHTKVDDKAQLIAGTEFGGGRVFPFPDGGAVTSSNITPDKATGIGNWSREQFIARFKMYADSNYHPNDVKAGAFNTAMPWMMYSRMTETDLSAIYTYLTSLKPVNNRVEKWAASHRVASK